MTTDQIFLITRYVEKENIRVVPIHRTMFKCTVIHDLGPIFSDLGFFTSWFSLLTTMTQTVSETKLFISEDTSHVSRYVIRSLYGNEMTTYNVIRPSPIVLIVYYGGHTLKDVYDVQRLGLSVSIL